MSLESYRAFACPDCDYYELQEDLSDVLSKGAIFVHDKNDNVRGSIAEGCLILCWTPEGGCYTGRDSAGLGAETIVFHAEFARSSMFKCVKKSSGNLNSYELSWLLKKIEEIQFESNQLAEWLRELKERMG